MPAFIVAEAGVNHMGNRATMLDLCAQAKAHGADAIKFQAYNTVKLLERRGITTRSEVAEVIRSAELSDADLDAIAAYCKGIGLKWFCSVFDPSQVSRVLSRGACALKLGHAENNYSELLEACALAVPADALWISGRPGTPVANVLCVEEYPAKSPPELHYIRPFHDRLREDSFDGFSSHYTDWRIPAAAALRGAKYIEAHVKLSNEDYEAGWSLSFADFAKMVKQIREYESWL